MRIVLAVLAVLIHTCCADRLIIDAPSSITLDNADAVFSNDISGMITYLMSFSSSWSKFVQGISVDPLKPAKANLFITVLDESFSKKLFKQENSFDVYNPNQILPSLQELNDEITKNFGENSLVIDESLTNHPSTFKNWNGKNLNDLIKILQSNNEFCSDSYPDSFKFTLKANENLKNEIEDIVSKFKALYKNDIIVEVLFTNANKPEVYRRSRRDADENADEQPTGLVKPNNDDQIIKLNLCFWTIFFIFVVVLFTSYSIWFMDPGFDSIIYKTTNYRIKSD